MSDSWYYVQKGNRHGPVDLSVLQSHLSDETLGSEDFVWKKGFENWKKIKEVPELELASAPTMPEPEPELPRFEAPKQNISLNTLGEEERSFSQSFRSSYSFALTLYEIQIRKA